MISDELLRTDDGLSRAGCTMLSAVGFVGLRLKFARLKTQTKPELTAGYVELEQMLQDYLKARHASR